MVEHLNPSFEYYGTLFDRPVGLVSYDSSQEGAGRRSFPFYQRTGYGGGGTGASAGQWAPFHGFDIEGIHHGIKSWFVKPDIGLGNQYNEYAGERYGHPRLKGLGEWLDVNPPEFEEQHEWDSRAANQWMMDRGAELMDPSALGVEDIQTGEPMDLAWRLLKRQTELGEHHPDLPSSYGPVTEYHGTTDLPSVLEQGLEGNVMARHRAVKPPTEMEGLPVVYTTDDPDAARQWAERRGKNLKIPSQKIGVIAVRGRGLPSIEQSDPRSQFRGKTRVHTPRISRQYLAPVE